MKARQLVKVEAATSRTRWHRARVRYREDTDAFGSRVSQYDSGSAHPLVLFSMLTRGKHVRQNLELQEASRVEGLPFARAGEIHSKYEKCRNSANEDSRRNEERGIDDESLDLC